MQRATEFIIWSHFNTHRAFYSTKNAIQVVKGMTAQLANISLERFLCAIRYYMKLHCKHSCSMFRQTKSLAFFHYPCVSRNFKSVSFYLSACFYVRECVFACNCINNCVHTCVPSIKHFIGFLSELLQVVPLFNTRFQAAVKRANVYSILVLNKHT